MDYNLALKLKNAGFPQISEMAWWEDVGMTTGNLPVDDNGFWTGSISSAFIGKLKEFQCEAYPIACIPTLEELIEACGDRFDELKREGNGWHCRPCYGHCTLYDSPTEAVANLWLSINKKTK